MLARACACWPCEQRRSIARRRPMLSAMRSKVGIRVPRTPSSAQPAPPPCAASSLAFCESPASRQKLSSLAQGAARARESRLVATRAPKQVRRGSGAAPRLETAIDAAAFFARPWCALRIGLRAAAASEGGDAAFARANTICSSAPRGCQAACPKLRSPQPRSTCYVRPRARALVVCRASTSASPQHTHRARSRPSPCAECFFAPTNPPPRSISRRT